MPPTNQDSEHTGHTDQSAPKHSVNVGENKTTIDQSGQTVLGHQVNIAGDAQIDHVGDITNIENVIQIIKNPAMWQDSLVQFLSAHRYYLLLLAIMEIALFIVFWRYKNMYLISWWWWALAAVLLLTSSWTFYTARLTVGLWRRVAIAVVSGLALILLVGWQTAQIRNPPQFEPGVFGITLAELGEGPSFRRSDRTREFKLLVYRLLCDITRHINDRAGTPDPCADEFPLPDQRPVAILPAGVIPDQQTAEAYGRRVNADIVIWGQLLVSEEGASTIRLQLIETLDNTVNPDFPVVLPVTANHMDFIADLGALDENEALTVLNELVAEESTAMTSFILGLFAYLDQDYVTAVNYLEDAVSLLKENVEPEEEAARLTLPLYYLGKANHLLGRIEEGQQRLHEAARLNQEEPAIPLSLAYGYRALRQDEEMQEQLDLAFALVNEWLDNRPDDLPALYDRGIMYELQGNPSFAIFDYDAIIEQNPDFYLAYVNKGIAAIKLGDYALAERALLQALDVAGRNELDDSAAQFRLAYVYERAGSDEGLVREAYEAALQGSPQAESIYLQYAEYLEGQGQVAEAEQQLHAMLDAVPHKGWAHKQIGRFLQRQGRPQEAIDSFERAVQQEPEDVEARVLLANTLYEQGQKEEAWSHYDLAVAQEPPSPYALRSYAWALQLEGEFEQAIAMYEESLALQPAVNAEWQNLVAIHVSLGNCEQAEAVLQRILSLRDDVPEEVVRFAEEALQNPDFCAAKRPTNADLGPQAVDPFINLTEAASNDSSNP